MQDFSGFSQVDFYLQLSPFLVYYCEFIISGKKKNISMILLCKYELLRSN